MGMSVAAYLFIHHSSVQQPQTLTSRIRFQSLSYVPQLPCFFLLFIWHYRASVSGSSSKEASLWGGGSKRVLLSPFPLLKPSYKQDIMGSRAHASMLAHQRDYKC
uniref:Uncharacterized protein n=1 Tax=Opuntia streptacantha TaxID=393608 RepID=A0A7C9EFB3_OPUST